MESEIWLVRHGETRLNQEHKLCGWSDVELTPRGREQAGWLRDQLQGERFDGVWASDLKRALETARITGRDPVVDERLREIHFGELEGKPYLDLPAEQKLALRDFENFRAPGGEDIGDFTARVYDFLDGLAPGRHLVFAHGGVCRAVTLLTGPEGFLSTGSLLAVDWAGKRLLFVRENELGTTSALNPKKA
jgi:probable phosphoglycerate mutase